MLDMNRMDSRRQWSPQGPYGNGGQDYTQQQGYGPRGMSDFGSQFGQFNGNNILQTLGDLLGQFRSRFGNNNPRTITDPGRTQVTDGANQLPPTAPMGTTYTNPFGASVTGGTLGAMLSRQPNY